MRKFAVATIVGSNRRESINRQFALALMRMGADQTFDFKLVQIVSGRLAPQD
jgi:chromate reductase, NAD(P)H dehydrogenase (quinone)